MDHGALNERFAKQLIDLLIAQGVTYFCCAPGSRSTPLLVAVASHPLAKRWVHFDERGLAFHALGFAKATRKPVAIIATSGTAVGNLLPASMEAYNERIPLILLTADRPPELQACGANQTCDQVRLFQNCTRFQIELPCPSSALPEDYLSTTVGQAVFSALHAPQGPVHINCMFREPLIASQPVPFPTSRPSYFSESTLYPSAYTIADWRARVSQVQRGVILCGSDHLPYSEAVLRLAEALDWPIFADILSPLRTRGAHELLFTQSDPLLKAKPDIAFDAIIQFGNRFVSKTLQQWLERQSLQFYLHVSDHTMRQDPSHLITHRLQTTPQIFCQELAAQSSLPKKTETELLKKLHMSCEEAMTSYFTENLELSEPGIFHTLACLFNEEWALFLANSMPIRDANQVFAPTHPCGPIFANRGVSGIDGNIATAVGIAQGCQKPTLAIIGDLTCLHDLNSLAQMTRGVPVVLLVINNSGGGIFSFLPISQREDLFEEMIAASHSLEFSKAAEGFGLPYYNPETLSELALILRDQRTFPQSCLIEVTTDRHKNVAIHQHLHQAIYRCLHSQSSLLETPLTLH